MTKEKITLIQNDPKNDPQQLQTRSVPTDDVKNTTGTN